jgi:hypothetical protein
LREVDVVVLTPSHERVVADLFCATLATAHILSVVVMRATRLEAFPLTIPRSTRKAYEET